MIKTVNLPITERREIADGVIEVRCELEGTELSFRAGQYIRVGVQVLLYPDSRGKNRNFNILSSPNNKDSISFAFLRGKSGFKRTLCEVPLGTEVEVKGPFGAFTLPERNTRSIVLVAEGIGITPCLSQILYATEQRLQHKLTLLYSTDDAKSAAYMRDLQMLGRDNPDFLLRTQFGRIDSRFIRKHIKDVKGSLWYISGTPETTAYIRKNLIQMDVAENLIRLEDFAGY